MMYRKTGRMVVLLLIMSGLFIVGVSASVYQQASQTITQTSAVVATITLKNSALGNLKEGQTQTYTKTTVANLGDAISITTTAKNVYLHLDSDLNSLTDYSTYNIVVKFSQVVGSTYAAGDTACTLTLASPDYSFVDLDATGTWKFDFEVTTTAGSVDADILSTVTMVVRARVVQKSMPLRGLR